MKRIVINGEVWASGLTPEAAEVVADENRMLNPGIDLRVEEVDQ